MIRHTSSTNYAPRIRERIDRQIADFRAQAGHAPDRLIISQSEYMALCAALGHVIHDYEDVPLLVCWGMCNA